MAYDDPFYGPPTDLLTNEADELPPEAVDTRKNPGLILAGVAAGLVVIGILIGVVITKSSQSD